MNYRNLSLHHMYIDECSTQVKKYEILLKKKTSKKARDGRKPSHAHFSLKGRKNEILGFGFCINQWSRECGGLVLKKLIGLFLIFLP
jgi:hypothetical protein